MAVFHNVRKIETYFLITHLFLTFVNKEFFSQEYIEMELKIFFITFEGYVEWQK